MRYLRLKRILDIFFAIVGILLLLPLLIILVILIVLSTKGPIIFTQRRFGINRTFFDIYKFRSMKLDAPKDVPTHRFDNHKKWNTPIGGFLRKTSLDELTQLINILKGDMSFVVPRPDLWNQDDLMALRDKYSANSVPVGRTGWAQVNGRDDLTLEEKARLDGEYAKNIGFMMDLRCLLKTIMALINPRGAV